MSEPVVGSVARPGPGMVWGQPGRLEVIQRVVMHVDRFCQGVMVESLVNGQQTQRHYCLGEESFVDVLPMDQFGRVYLGLQRRSNDGGVPRVQGFAGSIERGEGLARAATRELTEEFRETYQQDIEVFDVVPVGFWTQNDSRLFDLNPRHNQPNGHPSCKYGFGLLARVELLGDVGGPVEPTDEVIDRLPAISIDDALRYAWMGVIPAGALGEHYPEPLRCDNGDTTNLIFRSWLMYHGHINRDTDTAPMLDNLPFPIQL